MNLDGQVVHSSSVSRGWGASPPGSHVVTSGVYVMNLDGQTLHLSSNDVLWVSEGLLSAAILRRCHMRVSDAEFLNVVTQREPIYTTECTVACCVLCSVRGERNAIRYFSPGYNNE